MGLATAIAGCSSQQTLKLSERERSEAYQQRHERMVRHDAWQLEGKLAIHNGTDGGSGKLTWLNTPDRGRMNFTGALGRGAWQLDDSENVIRLQKANGDVFETTTIEEMIRIHVGWAVPVDALRWWVRGLEGPEPSSARTLDDRGRLESLTQRGWTIDFGGYTDVMELEFPKRVIARKGEYSVKLAISRWSLPGKSTGIQ
jgi:outer membrane lipoprotein LolB